METNEEVAPKVGKVVVFVADPEGEQSGRTGGCLIAQTFKEDPKKIHVGYSFRHSYLDAYNKELGQELAEKRLGWLIDSNYKPRRVHPRYRPTVMLFLIRCMVYFKFSELPQWAKDFMKDEENQIRTQDYLAEFGTEYQKKKFHEFVTSGVVSEG